MMIIPTALFCLLCNLWTVRCAEILVVSGMPAPSHFILGSSLAKGLAEKGHNVTIISCFPETRPPKNGTYHEIILTGLYEEMQEKNKQVNMFERIGGNPFFNIGFMVYFLSEYSEKTLGHPNVQKFLKTNPKFDVVIVQQFVNDGLKVLAPHLGAHLVVLSTLGANNWINPLVGNPAPPSYIPELALSYPSTMSFFQRCVNTLLMVHSQFIYHFFLYPSQNRMVKKYLPNAPELNQVLYNSSLVLLNSHPSISQPTPYVPNMIEIGGYHIKPPKKLPEDLQNFLDNAKEGVIYFSMGSNLKSANLHVDKRDALLRVFSKLKQKILWKWEDDVLPGKPHNVKLGKWLPQQDILAHPNVKLFITHGGLLSTTETTYHGVPVLAFPIYGDQEVNARMAVNNGIGISLSYHEISEDTVEKAINELLRNPKYRENAKKRSLIFHDREVEPMDRAIYWVEYVIRHGGAPHLRVAGLKLPWYRYLVLDVVAFLFICTIVTLYVCFVLMKITYKKCFKSRLGKIKKN